VSEGYDIRDNLVIDRASGAYRFAVETEGLRRFTAYVRYAFVDSEGDYAIEEIDVDARDVGEAQEVAEAARDAHYEEGGVIVTVEERFGLYL
jgi:hypothetical protein